MWDKLKEIEHGVKTGELVVLVAGEGSGKSIIDAAHTVLGFERDINTCERIYRSEKGACLVVGDIKMIESIDLLHQEFEDYKGEDL